ncbi:UNVERIFIED_CONTAM: hypothetical protein K2H54_051566 [Gekko kuhli]
MSGGARMLQPGAEPAAAAAPRAPPPEPSPPAPRRRLSPASLLLLSALLADPRWLCAAAELRAKERGLAMPAPAPLNAACTARHPWPGPRDSGPLRPAAAPPAAFLARHFANFSLPFCDRYTIWDLLLGMAGPESLDCSLDTLRGDFRAAASGGPHGEACRSCLEAYQRLDQHAQEKYEEFDLLLEKYLQAEDYSVRSCLRDCKANITVCIFSASKLENGIFEKGGFTALRRLSKLPQYIIHVVVKLETLYHFKKYHIPWSCGV